MIEAKAKLKNIRISAKKVRLVAGVIRGLDVVTASDRLAVIFKKSSPIINKLLQSAIANATDLYNVKKEDLIIKSIIVNEGMALKRWKPAAFGRAHPFKKHSSHVEIILTTKEGVKVNAKDKKKEKIETVDLTDVKKKGKDSKAKEDKKKDKKEQKPMASNKEGKKRDNTKIKKG